MANRNRCRFRADIEHLESRAVPTATINIPKTLYFNEAESRSIAVTRSGTTSELNQTLKVNVQFTDGTAKYGKDYVRSLGPTSVLTFKPGVKVIKLNPVKAIDDDVDEHAETFTVNLSLPAGMQANFANRTLVATIWDKDPVPLVGFDLTNFRRDKLESAGIVSIPVRLSKKSEKTITVEYRAKTFDLDRWATYGKDFFFSSFPSTSTGRLVFKPGETLKTLRVTIREDTIYEDRQSFKVGLTKAYNGYLFNFGDFHSEATIDIEDNDLPSLRIDDATPVVEGHGTTTVNAKFKITLLERAETAVTFKAFTLDGTAKRGVDYKDRGGDLTFERGGATSMIVQVPVAGDLVKESTAENFYVKIASAGNFSDKLRIVRGQAKGTIVDDDGTTPPPLGKPAPISAIHTPENGAGAVLYRWSAAAGADTYVISVRNASTGIVEFANGLQGTSFQATAFSKLWRTSGTHFWKIRAVNGAQISDWSAEQSFVIP